MPRNSTHFRAPLATDPAPGGTTMWLAGSRQWADPWAMSMSQIEMVDIALALSRICRYNGHVEYPLSVAEHSVNVMLRMKLIEKGYRPSANDLIAALLHDAAEAYLGDIHGPSKKLPEFAFYRAAEDRLMSLIYARFGVDVDDELADRISLCDRLVFETEWPTPGGQMSAEGARRQFMGWYSHLRTESLLGRKTRTG